MSSKVKGKVLVVLLAVIALGLHRAGNVARMIASAVWGA
jgi:hypothetical protein